MMELKVWCDGIPRVVCGVNELTTCQNVVMALASAAGRTGRYTLVEKWRNNERMVAPDESLITSLQKWGEYASEVQFILRHASSSGKSRRKREGSGRLDSSKRSNLDSQDFNSQLCNESRLAGSRSSLKKSLTFSGAHTYPMAIPKSSKSPNRLGPGGKSVESDTISQQNSSMESIDERGSFTSPSVSPYSSFDLQQQRWRNAPAYSSQSSTASQEPCLSPRRPPPPPPYRIRHANGGGSASSRGTMTPTPPAQTTPTPPSRNGSITPTGSIDRKLIRVPNKLPPSIHSNLSVHPPSGVKIVHSHESPRNHRLSTFQELNDQNKNQPLPPKLQPFRSSLPKTNHPQVIHQRSWSHDKTEIIKEPNNNDNLDKRPNANVSKPEPVRQRTSPVQSKTTQESKEPENRLVEGKDGFRIKEFQEKVTQSDSVSKQELIKMVNLQRERLKVQETQMNTYKSEIEFRERRDKELTAESQTIVTEIDRLEKTNDDIETEIQELEIVSWEEKLEREKKKEQKFQTELLATRSQLKACQSEYKDLQEKIQNLEEEMEIEKDKIAKSEQEKKEKEDKILKDVSELENLVKEKLDKHDEQEKTVKTSEGEIKNLEEGIKEKKEKIGELEAEVRDANMRYFSVGGPLDMLRRSREGRSAFDRLSPTRPGSARRLHSPQRLGDAVPTIKDPHGLWV